LPRQSEDSDTTWEVFDEETQEYIELTVHYEITAGSPQHTDYGNPQFSDIGSAPDIEIQAVETPTGEPYKLSREEQSKVIDKIAEEHEFD
jgi:hypothetical protein